MYIKFHKQQSTWLVGLLLITNPLPCNVRDGVCVAVAWATKKKQNSILSGNTPHSRIKASSKFYGLMRSVQNMRRSQ